MIAVDTSALMAILMNEPNADACMQVLARDGQRIVISAGTAAEVRIVAGQRGLAGEIERFLDELGIEVVPVTEATARQVGEAYATWGRGVHPAGLNFGDCFAYVVARAHGCPLLYIGNDFSRTDIASALAET